MKKLTCLCLFALAFCSVRGQNYPVGTISEDLKKDAFAVVRESSQSYIQQDERNGVYRSTVVITILSDKGDDFSGFIVYEDNNDELKSFSGEVFDAAGKSTKKIGKKDLTTTALSANLATDSKRTFYNYNAPSYPYTIKYVYELKNKNGLLSYPPFDPIDGYQVALEKADYTLQIPENLTLRSKNQGTSLEPEVTTLQNNKVYKWHLDNVPAVSYEKYAPVEELFPVVFLSPETFCWEKSCGSMATWTTFGEWQNTLLQGRDQLDQKTIDKVSELTQGISDQREIVKILYQYMQNTTHYVSIQLGIGGWQPMPAAEVARTGFGDCKALSNYMRSLLKIVEIPSYYTVISTRKERFFSDFPSFGQSNHAILMVPLQQDTVFLECTSQMAPFGYISDLAGHDALTVGEDKAFFYTLPDYQPWDNAEINHVQIQLNADGKGHLEAHTTLKNEDFERLFYRLKTGTATEQTDAISGLLRVHKPQISNVSKEEILDSHPQIDVYYTVDCEDFATQTGSRLLLNVNPARTSLKGMLSGSSRKFDIDLKTAHYQKDTIAINIPDGYIVETKPKPTEIDTEYGTFKSEITQENGQVIYIQSLELKKGRFPAAAFEEMKKFYNRIETLQNGQIGFKTEKNRFATGTP
jgi:hypothetical protein